MKGISGKRRPTEQNDLRQNQQRGGRLHGMAEQAVETLKRPTRSNGLHISCHAHD